MSDKSRRIAVKHPGLLPAALLAGIFATVVVSLSMVGALHWAA